MSEEEIIKIIEKLQNIFQELKKDDEEGHTSAYEMQFEDFEAMKVLLDLYNKEKEKNKILENLLQGNLFEMYKYYKDLCNSYQGNSVSKDKIKEKMEKLEDIRMENLSTQYYGIVEQCENKIEVLEELLEE